MSIEPADPSPRHFEWRIFPAVAIIAVGVLVLLNNLGVDFAFFDHGNWWALFVLFAAIAPLTRAYEVYHARGRLDAEAAYSLLAGTAVVLVAVLVLFGLDWGTWWPLFVILGGLFTLVRRPYRHCRSRDWHADDDATLKR